MNSSLEELVANLRATIPALSVLDYASGTLGPSVVLLDCRESEEVSLGIIPGALWIPKGKVDIQIEKECPDKNIPVVVYCASGYRSLLVAGTLRGLGYKDVYNLTGGIEQWKSSGQSIETFRAAAINRRRYKAQLALPEIGDLGQEKLGQARVLLVGCGGLGSPTALYLAAAGVGQLGLVDGDFVDESNLQRQILHTTDRMGLAKVESAYLTLKSLNPHVKIEMHKTRIDAKNIDEIASGYHLIIDGCDNFETRYLVNEACLKNKIVNIHGSVFGFQGQVATLCAEGGPCYRCLFPHPPDAGIAPNCAEGGVLGAVVGVTGSLVAVEAIKWLLGHRPSEQFYLMAYDGLAGQFDRLRIKKVSDCPSCSPDSNHHYDFSFESQVCERR